MVIGHIFFRETLPLRWKVESAYIQDATVQCMFESALP
jgi:hypothetical protein